MLPDPDPLPSTDVVIYDADCRLCRKTVQVLDRIDRRQRLAYLPLQDKRVATRYPDLSPADLEQYVHVIDMRGRRHRGADAVRYLTRRLPALWILFPLLHLPGSKPVWKWLYHQLSRRRHLLD